MMTVIAKATCRCCNVEMQFLSLARAQAAFKSAGLNETAVIVDDEGTKHSFVNTFEALAIDEVQPRPARFQLAA